MDLYPIAASSAPAATPAPFTHPTPPIPPTPPRLRMWPVLLTLYFLAPMLAEVLSGSTAPLMFIQPFGFIFIPLLYGSSAILIREVIVRRRLGWANVLILGAAFGISQEALIVQTWFNFMAKSSPSHTGAAYGIVLGTDWDWALSLTIYHAVISITLPLILLGLLFPRRAALPGLGPKRAIALLIWLIVPCALLAINVATRQFAKEGYTGPPLAGYLIACALLIVTLLVGCFVRFPTARPRPDKHAPGVWTVRLSVFGLTLLFFAQALILPNTPLPIPLAVTALLFAFCLWRISSWAARSGWNDRHRLAIVMGVLAYYLFAWSPLIEFVARLPLREGLTLADVLAMLGLFLLDWRLKRRMSANPGEPASPTQSSMITRMA